MKPECSLPLPDSVLLEWWAGDLTGHASLRVDEHLLSCASCFARAEALNALAEEVSALVRAGRVRSVVSADVLEKLHLEGRTIREYRVPAGGGVQCTVAPDDEIMVMRLEVPLDAPARLDMVSRIDAGPETRIGDLPFDPSAGELIVLVPIDEIRLRPAHVERISLVAVDASGERRLGEYTFNHTPWPV